MQVDQRQKIEQVKEDFEQGSEMTAKVVIVALRVRGQIDGFERIEILDGISPPAVRSRQYVVKIGITYQRPDPRLVRFDALL